jgi:hypothetical protein
MAIDTMKMKEEIRKKRMSGFYGRRYWYTTPNDGTVCIGVRQGLGGAVWIVGYVRESCGTRAIKSKRLLPGPYPDTLQDLLDVWAEQRQLAEVVNG